MKDKKQKIETLAVRQGFTLDQVTNSIAQPIYPSTAFVFNDADHGADLFDLSVSGNIYGRLTNTSYDRLGNALSLLEGGIGGVTAASGLGAIMLIMVSLCRAGDHIIASKSLYGGTNSLFVNTFAKFGIETSFVDQDASYEELAKVIRPQTKFIFAEVLANPRVNVLDMDKFSKLAKQYEIPLIIDSTFTPPCIFKPIEYGADIVMHSLSKYIGGHGNALGGVIIDAGNYDWSNGKFPELTEPDASYHGLVYTKAFGKLAFIAKARAHALRDTGATLSPFNAFLISNGLQTLHLRLDYVSKNSLELAKWLEKHPKIKWVSHPLLENNPQYDLAKRYFPKGAGGIFSFGISGNLEDSKTFINGLELCYQAVNVGDVRTIVTHPASTTHRQCTKEELIEAGISENFIRVSLGLENLEDIKEDLAQALGRIK